MPGIRSDFEIPMKENISLHDDNSIKATPSDKKTIIKRVFEIFSFFNICTSDPEVQPPVGKKLKLKESTHSTVRKKRQLPNTCNSITDMEEKSDDNFAKAIQSDKTVTKKYILDLIDRFYAGTPKAIVNPPTETKLQLKKTPCFKHKEQKLDENEDGKMKETLKYLEENEIIRPSKSKYVSTASIDTNEDDTSNLQVDFKMLNSLLLPNQYVPIMFESKVESVIRNAKKYFSLFHIKNVYYNIPLEEESMKYTSFKTKYGHYEYTKLPPGLKITDAKCEQYLNQVLNVFCKLGVLTVSMEGILIATETESQHVEILVRFFICLIQNNLQLDLPISNVLCKEIEYRTYLISENGYKPKSTGLEPIQKYPVPQNVQDVKIFLHLCSSFQQLIENYEEISKPLYDMKANGSQFGKNELIAFQKLQMEMITPPVLATYNHANETELFCDGSAVGYGAVLMQLQSDKKWHPVYYFSKKASEAEKKQTEFDREAMAIIYGVDCFRERFLGTTITMVTDSQKIVNDLTKTWSKRRTAALIYKLNRYQYEIQWRPRKELAHADALSRRFPQENCISYV